jgi:hypothetical protein
VNVLEYVKANYESLPKSTFNNDEVVIVHESHNSNEGWGNHSYSGYGVDNEGRLFLCYSSGCSCRGSCGIDHEEDTKKLEIDETDFPNFHAPENINFNALSQSFSDY